MATEAMRITGADLVRLELKDDKGTTTDWNDLTWPAAGGDLLLTSGAGGIAASGPLVDGLRPYARFHGASLSPKSVKVSLRPLDAAAVDPAKMANLTIVSFVP